MDKTRKAVRAMRLLFAVIVAAGMAACASMGRPEGGARDETPPEFVRSNPMPGELNVNRTRYEVWFDENIQLEDAFNKVIVSPTQTTPPTVRSNGKRLTVELRDTLVPDATYTIDFADAIKDLNEGNILDGFALDFSTGSEIDTLRLSGIVLEARTLEPAQGITVGIYSDMTDTTLTKRPFERVARTNQYGQFTVRNLKPGNYHVFALNDLNRDNRWDRSEDIAFMDYTVSPYAESITVSDTLRTKEGEDSVVTRPGTAYYPNDILLTWFNEDYKPQYLRDHDRPERRRITIGMGAPSDSLPTLTIASGPLEGRDLLDFAVLQKSQTNDTLAYWLRGEAMATDSLLLAVRHQQTDTLNQLVWQTDTVRFFYREPKSKKKKKDEKADTLPPPTEFIGFGPATQRSHEIYDPLKFRSSTPLETIDTTMFHLVLKVDTTMVPVPMKPIVPSPLNPLMEFSIDFDRIPGGAYTLTIDSTAVTDIYGLHNNKISHEFTVKNPDEYSGLVFALQNVDSTAVVELLDGSENVVRQGRVDPATRKVRFEHLTPGTFYARVFLDRNLNDRWDTGNVADSLQPEEVYYYPKKLDLKANWDIEQTWDIYELALDAQKPSAIKKNKPKLKKGETDPYANGEDEQEYDEWGEPIDPNNRGNSFYDSRNGRGNGRGQGNRGNSFGGRFQQSTGTAAIRR